MEDKGTHQTWRKEAQQAPNLNEIWTKEAQQTQAQQAHTQEETERELNKEKCKRKQSMFKHFFYNWKRKHQRSKSLTFTCKY